MANTDWGKRVEEIEQWLHSAEAAHSAGSELTKELDKLGQQIRWHREKLAQAQALVAGNDDAAETLDKVRELAARLGDVPESPAVISEQAPPPAEPPKGGRPR